jgi:hypothetical protein
MNWPDYEFIRDIPAPDEVESPLELTGWETVVFQLADDEPAAPPGLPGG